MKNLLMLGRVQFLIYSPLAFGLGTIIATYSNYEFNMLQFFLGQFIVSVIHLMTHYFNEYYDLDTDSANLNPSPWTGGSRILANNIINPIVSLRIGIGLALISLILIFLFMKTPTTQLICVAGLLLAWGYSAPPLRLSRRGLGELTTAVCLNLLGPVLGFMLQVPAGEFRWDALVILLHILMPLTVIQYIRMIVMNIPDRYADASVGKKTLVVRAGIQKVATVHALGMMVAYCLILINILLEIGIPGLVSALLLLTAPLGFLTTRKVWRYSKDFDDAAFFNVPYLATTHMALCVFVTLLGFTVVKSQDILLYQTHIEIFSVYLYLFVMGMFYLKKFSKGKNFGGAYAIRKKYIGRS